MGLEAKDVLATLRTAGVPEEAIERAVERGDPQSAIFDSIVLPWREERTISARDIEAQGGLAVEELGRLIAASGLAPPPPDEPAFTVEEAKVFVEFQRLREVWPPELAVQTMRLYGRLLARIAQSSVRIFRSHVEHRLREAAGDAAIGDQAVAAALADLVPLADPLLIGVHRRWVEHELAQEVVSTVDSRALNALPGAAHVALLFCDLKDFTAYAEREGDLAAVEAIDRFLALVSAQRGARCRFQKTLGDGVMLAYDASGDAVDAGERLLAGLRDAGAMRAHASVHEGVAIVREGDYFGGMVNVAARLLGFAGRDELIATPPVVSSCGERFRWEPAGTARIRGVRDAVELARLA